MISKEFQNVLQTETLNWTEKLPWTKRAPEPITRLEGAQEYDQLADKSFAESDKAFAKELSLIIPTHTSVVDIGCGPAGQDIELAKLRPDLHIFGLDYSQEMLEIAKHKAEKAQLSDRFHFEQADMTALEELNFMPGGRMFVFSNTALHELRTNEQLSKTFRGIADLIGESGEVYLRDLIRPRDGQQAKAWREEVLGTLGDSTLSYRELELFYNSQRAAFSLPEIQNAIDSTSLKGRGKLSHLNAPKSRYWTYEIKSAA